MWLSGTNKGACLVFWNTKITKQTFNTKLHTKSICLLKKKPVQLSIKPWYCMGKVSCCLFCKVLGFIPEREWRHSSSSQLLVPHPFLVFIYFQFEFFGLDHSVFISVLVSEHVVNNLLHGQPGPYTTFALCHLQLDELPELKWVER